MMINPIPRYCANDNLSLKKRKLNRTSTTYPNEVIAEVIVVAFFAYVGFCNNRLFIKMKVNREPTANTIDTIKRQSVITLIA